MTDYQDKDLSALGDTFKQIIGHMKGGFPIWEDFVIRGLRFQKHIEQTIAAFNSFLEGFNRIAELATHTKGATKDIGSGLTNLVMWHKGQELKLREINQALMTKLITPLQGKVEEWKKTTSLLDKEHEKEVQKSIKEVKESFKSTMKVKSKLKKDKPPEKANALQHQFEQQQQETDRRFHEAEEKERRSLNRVLLEERSWFCGFATAFTRVLDVEAGMFRDLERLQTILKDISTTVGHPNVLPESTREFVENWMLPASPATQKRVASTLSVASANSETSIDSIGAPVPPGYPPEWGLRRGSASLPPPPPGPPGPIPPPPMSHLPPPPPTYFPTDAYNNQMMTSNISNRPLPPLPDEQVSPPTSAMSVSPSQASLMSNSSHQSTESSRSLSPPIGPSRSPAQLRAQLESLQEDVVEETSAFQQALMNKLRLRAHSDTCPVNDNPRVNLRTCSLGSKPPLPSPPVSRKPRPPPPVPHKPVKNRPLAEISASANGSHFSHPHHIIQPNHLTSRQESSSGSDEDESAFAKALKQKSLRATGHVRDRSNPRYS